MSGDRKLVLAFDAKRLFNNFTGLGNYSRTLIKNLQFYYPEHEYHLFTPKIVSNEETSYFLDNDNFFIHLPKSTPFLYRTFVMSKQINELSPDIFHGLSHELPIGLSKNIKTVVTFHDLIYEQKPRQFNYWDTLMYKTKYRRSAKMADGVIAISQSTKNDLYTHYRISEEKITVCYQSCHEIFQNFESTWVKNSHATPYLYVGSVTPRKNLLSIVEAYHLLPAAYQRPFVIIGSGSGDYIHEVKSRIQKYGLESKFTFVGNVPNVQLLRYYADAFALIFPSHYEGFGIPIIEALFCMTPVVTSKLSSLPEAAGPGGIFVKDPKNIEQIMDAMIQLHDQALYNKLSLEGHEFVKTNYNSSVTSARVIEYYKKLR